MIGAARRAFDHHFFAPQPLRDLAIARIVIFGAQLLLFEPGLELQLRRVAADDSLWMPIPALRLLTLTLAGPVARPDAALVTAVWYATRIFGMLAVVGLMTRLSCFAFAAANTFLIAHAYSFGELHHSEAVLIIALWTIAAGPCGRRLSLDAWLRRTLFRRPRDGTSAGGPDNSPMARWPLRTISWVLVLTYLSAGLAKLIHSRLAWMNGYTLRYYLVNDGLRFDKPFGTMVGGWPLTLLVLLSIGAIALECGFALAILKPRLAWLILASGASMHVCIDITMGATFFQTVACYVVFIEPLRASARGAKRRLLALTGDRGARRTRAKIPSSN